MKKINPKAAVEVLEIIKYLDKSVNVDLDIIKKLEEVKDVNYKFTINFDIPFFDNDFMDETIELLNEIIQ